VFGTDGCFGSFADMSRIGQKRTFTGLLLDHPFPSKGCRFRHQPATEHNGACVASRATIGEKADAPLERCVWHSAQHARQIIPVFEKLGIRPDSPLTQKDYAGPPMLKVL
jgi:hypothetical protein